MKCDLNDNRTLNVIEVCYGCSTFNMVNDPMVVQMCPNFAKFALMHLLSSSYIWTATASCCLVQEAHSSIINSRGMKSSGVYRIGTLWSIYQPRDFDYKTNMPPRDMCMNAYRTWRYTVQI
jgi:hypothetical protein